MRRVLLLDFDGAFYQIPTNAIAHLEDRIDSAMLHLLSKRLSEASESEYRKCVDMLNEAYRTIDKSQLVPNLHNQNAGGDTVEQLPIRELEGKTFMELCQAETAVYAARALGKIIGQNPLVPKNHRISGMMNLGLGVTMYEIELYYRMYATINYSDFKICPNMAMVELIREAQKNGDVIMVWTDNSSSNVITGLQALSSHYDSRNFIAIIDQFDCGGYTKKTEHGVKNGLEVARQKLREKGIDPNNCRLEFYDDNPQVCESVTHWGVIPSFVVKSDVITALN
ncbi:MAG: hypothetical protein LBR70_00465 [Lactobacillaceae bacterium]|jgi:hypothetical protein|nr:hypothetical protein [Lactobacillaceae bacterium]